MSATSSSASSSQSRTDTLIGAGMRVAGRIAFKGVLRVQGDVLGDVTCQGDAGGTLVVDTTGSVTGAVEAPRIVVRGRVIGPLRAAQSIDLQPGGNVVGDAYYREIVIHAGGLIDGALTPAQPIDEVRELRSGPALPAGAPGRPPSVANAAPAAGGAGFARRFGVRGALAAAVLALAIAAGVWMSRTPPASAPPAAEAVANEAATPSASPAPEPAAPPAPAAPADTRAPAQPAPPSPPAAGAEEVVVVQGVNPAKPAGVFLLVSKEPTVLYRKKHEEAGEGKRHVVPQGKAVSVAIGRNELFRVAEGRDLEIFYQGRKVSPKAIETGAWLRFVPHGAVAAGGERQAGSEGGSER